MLQGHQVLAEHLAFQVLQVLKGQLVVILEHLELAEFLVKVEFQEFQEQVDHQDNLVLAALVEHLECQGKVEFQANLAFLDKAESQDHLLLRVLQE